MKTDCMNNENLSVSNDVIIKSAWNRPVVSRIDIKRTLLGSGSISDSSGFTV